MADPVLHLLVGPKGSGKSTFFTEVLGPVTGLELIDADEIAASRWLGADTTRAREAAELAASMRERATIRQRRSFATETKLSDPSRIALMKTAMDAGYRVTLHIFMIPEDLAVERRHLDDAIDLADETFVYDNTRAAEPFRPVAAYVSGRVIGKPTWPKWAPPAITRSWSVPARLAGQSRVP